MKTNILAFPSSVALATHVPPLHVMARMLMQEEVWPSLDRFEIAITRRAWRIVNTLGDDAPPKLVAEYMRYLFAILSRHYVEAPIEFERVAS